ncbi:DUF4175 family protein [Pollutibacter soli]|uniref:DUF4175 family protein n=1 Tax=Pollutibacter soli TaxID=3034157 RepID=UPI0030133EAB
MNKAPVNIIFQKIRDAWVRSTWLAWIITAISISLVMGFFLSYLFGISYLWLIPVTIILAVLLIRIDKSWKIDVIDVARFLDREYPELEESSVLLLNNTDDLNFLQQIQMQKAMSRLQRISHPQRTNPKLKLAFGVLAISALVISVMAFATKNSLPKITGESPVAEAKTETVKRPLIVKSIDVWVRPPAYTGIKEQHQRGGSIKALPASKLRWEINVSGTIHAIEIVVNDSKRISAQSSGGAENWEIRSEMPGQGYYQVNFSGQSSPLYQIELITDQSPEIKVQSPAPDLLIRYGDPERFKLNALIKDDYGISAAKVSATVSRGSGEAVKFEQKNIPTGIHFSAHAREYQINQQIDLKSLGMIPGDELYLFVSAVDNNKQEKRSDIFRVILEDTAQLFSMEGLNSGLDIKPEFFRSQRQIIIETEQLLRDQLNISKEQFQEKSNSLGIDQKLLRLRYGKFLGEESSTYEHEGDGHEDDATGIPDNNADILSEYGHSHDNAEDATYFDAETKKQLRATLNEMWKSELQLRTYKPKDALPFEYEALRLLKDLQQKSRAYVAKTNLKTTPLKPETRLTGDLREIVQPVYSIFNEYKPSPDDPVRNALGTMNDLMAGKSFNSSDLEELRKAHLVLSRRAMDAPADYLAALKSLRTILPALESNQPVQSADVIKVSKAFQLMLTDPSATPSLKTPVDKILSDIYFSNLKKLQH